MGDSPKILNENLINKGEKMEFCHRNFCMNIKNVV